MNNWFVYIIRCADDSLYTGITTDLHRRIAQHNDNHKPASKYTYCRHPVTLVYQEKEKNRSLASKREYQIKQLNRRQKEQLIKYQIS